VDGGLSWVSDGGWERRLAYAENTLVTDVQLVHAGLGLELAVADTVDFDRPLLVRRVTVRNRRDHERSVTLYVHHDFDLFEHALGDTAYFDPWTKGLVHYKRTTHFLINALAGDRVGFTSYATGAKGTATHEGTWRDSEDGQLGRNPIAQGSVDSVGAVDLVVPAGGTAVAHLWMIASDDFFKAKDQNDVVVQRGPESYLVRTQNYWQYWVTRDRTDLSQLAPRLRQLYRRSLLILRTQIDNRGAIIAANDSDIKQFGRDTYSYMWPRDGALVTEALIGANQREVAARFFEFCAQIIQPGGFMLHKYTPDGAPGSSWHPWADAHGDRILPIQEDETALVLYALGLHHARYDDTEFIKPFYSRLVKAAAEFLVRYRHTPTGLPGPSWDLWEERRGIHAFTVAAVWAGLQAAARFAEGFGETALAAKCRTASDEIRAAALAHLFDRARNRFVRTLEVRPDGSLARDATLDASLYGVWKFGLVAPSDPAAVSTMEALRDGLTVRTSVGGMARYQHDAYHRAGPEVAAVPGNPWFICTLWLADWYIATAGSHDDLERAYEILEWVAARALPSGTLAEQVHPHSGEPLSVSPLTWSHAAFVTTVQNYAVRSRQLAQ